MSKLKYGVYNGRTIKRILENSRLYFLTSFFIIGIIIGAVSIKSDSGGVTDLSLIHISEPTRRS